MGGSPSCENVPQAKKSPPPHFMEPESPVTYSEFPLNKSNCRHSSTGTVDINNIPIRKIARILTH